MKKNRQILATCIISVVILLGVYLLITARGSNDGFTVYVLKTDLEAGTAVDGGMFDTATISGEALLANAVRDVGYLKDKVLVRGMKSGDILSAGDLGNVLSGVQYPDLAEGKELYSLSVKPENANGWWLYEGNRINLYIYLPEEIAYSQQNSKDSDLVENPAENVIPMENIRIMRILNECGGLATSGDKNNRILCLELDAEQVKLLVVAEKGGIVRLSAQNKK